MTKISQYSTDVNITGNDKWIGSDAQNFLITKNFTPNNLANFFNGNNVIDIGASIRYMYQTLDPGEAREQGTISFETEIGPQVNFSAITTFLIAKNTLKGNTVSQYLDFLVDSKVLLSRANNINIFGYYKITSIEPWIPNTNFFVVEVDFLAGNGFISEDLDYLVSLVDKAQDAPTTVWGSITGDIEDQTDLINYISSQIIAPTLVALPFTTDHLAITNNQYVVGDVVWYLGNVYRCIANNDSIIPTSSLYWTNLGTGYPLVQQPSDWNSTSGNNQILNKPTIPTVGTWGALNYPTWSTGTPFVKMTAAGTFALDTNTYVTTANLTLQNAYNNSTDATIILDATRGDIKVKSIAGITKSMSFFDPLGNEVLTFHSEPFGSNIKRISANNNNFYVDSGSNIKGNDLTINNIYSSQDIYLSNNKSLISYSSPLVSHYFKGTSGIKWESDVKIEYAADYSTLYSNRSLIDKGYADSTYLTSAVTSVGATSPITSSGGATPVISTSMATNKLIGRSTAGTGVMEEITIGTGLTLSGGTLNASATGVTSVGLTMPSAFTVTNSPITSSGDIAVTGAGLVSQYVRGDGTLANFPNSTGGGSSVNYYLNGSVSQGTFGGTTYYQMSKTPILGAGTNFIRTNGAGNGYIASFITDAGDPSFLNIPGGNWNLEFYFQSSATGGSPQFYGEIYKVSATNVFTLVASGSANPEGITNGTTVDQYFTSISVPQTSLLITDRLAIRIYVITSGRTITLHTENGNLCEVLTTFTTGLTALNGLTQQVQNLTVGTSGTDFAISSATDTHTFNLPTASASNRGALSSTDWSTFNSKQNALGFTAEDVANKQTNLTASATKYPTVNAVNTGLALKQNILSYTPYRNIQTSQTSVTGTTAETVVFTATIPAGTFSSTDIIKVLFGVNKSTALGTYALRIRVNTTNTISGAPTIALYSGTATAQVNVMMRNFNLNGGNLYGFPFTTSGLTDIVAQGGSLGSTTLNPANQFFIFATVIPNNASDSIIGNMFSISN